MSIRIDVVFFFAQLAICVLLGSQLSLANDEDSCVPNPCQNGGTCVSSGCICEPDIEGSFCEIVKVEDEGFCRENPCKNGGTCFNDKAKKSFSCLCESGYIGKTCEKMSCVPNRCQNNGNCEVTNDGYRCHCEKPYFGDNCEQEIISTELPTSIIETTTTSSISSTKIELTTTNSNGTASSRLSSDSQTVGSSTYPSSKITSSTKYTSIELTSLGTISTEGSTKPVVTTIKSTSTGKTTKSDSIPESSAETTTIATVKSTSSDIGNKSNSIVTSGTTMPTVSIEVTSSGIISTEGSTKPVVTTIKSTGTGKTTKSDSISNSSAETTTITTVKSSNSIDTGGTTMRTMSMSSDFTKASTRMVKSTSEEPTYSTKSLTSDSSVMPNTYSNIPDSTAREITEWITQKSSLASISSSSISTEMVELNSTISDSMNESRDVQKVASYVGGSVGALAAIAILTVGIVYYSKRVKRRRLLIKLQSVEVSSIGSADSSTSLA